MRARVRNAAVAVLAATFSASLVAACRPTNAPADAAARPETTPTTSTQVGVLATSTQVGELATSTQVGDAAARGGGIAVDAGATVTSAEMDAAAPSAPTDPMATHADDREGLLALFSLKPLTEQQQKVVRPDLFLASVFGTTGPSKINQGNKSIARHTISKAQCLEGLKDVVIQTPEQRRICGEDNMVPVWVKGKPPWFCIDVFEFPNKPCELPMVWSAPTHAKKVCELQGKRLCSDIEWNVACRGDPEGGPDQRYAYGDRLDLEICHTNLRHRSPPTCSAKDAQTAWKTCATDTEPSGSFPECRSRFGVFDQHGNVAEVMMRREGEKVLTQLKGSAWFYVELAKEPGEKVPESTTNKEGAYPDHCNFDPRWHVEDYATGAWHVNYHLGFRCCKSIP